MELDHGAAIVTGAAGGIGSVIARRLTAAGMSVVMADLDATRLESERASVLGAYPDARVVAVRGDVGDTAHHADLVDAAESLGGLRLAVLNAGVSLQGLSWELPLEQWELTTRVNYWGVVHGLRAALSTMVPRGDGWVVAVSSGAGLVATPGMAPYVATKHAVVGFMESTHHELARIGSPVGVGHLPGEHRHRHAGPHTRCAVSRRGETDPAHREVVATLSSTIRSGVEAGADPATVADALCDGVAAEQFWILPQPELAWADRSHTAAGRG
ncbi:MAG: SDR family NAD(P)-dependent oxidoreductase [Microthrixaceae bacterium]